MGLKILFFSKFPTTRLESRARKLGLRIVRRQPDIVVCWGGDGTFLLAEQKFPGITKAIVRKNSICKKCNGLTMEELLSRLSGLDDVPARHHLKLSGRILQGKRTTTLPLATNDIILRNSRQMHAARFHAKACDITLAENQVGDGIVISTPFGSSAYYRSITGETFEQGIGIAFNNTTQHHPPILADESTIVEVTLARGPATVSIDTLEKTYMLHNGAKLIVTASKERARIMDLN